MEIKQRQSYAPFGSVSRKKDKKSKKQNQQPGPGSYDVSLPLITPVVQTIRKRNNNIIVKLGHIGTSSFLGSEERFRENKNALKLGPGEYERDQSDQKVENKKNVRTNAATLLKQLIPYQYERTPTISEIKKVQFQDEIEMPARESMVRKRYMHKGDRGSVWSRMTQDRLPSPKINPQLGPGSYDVDIPKDIRKYRGSHHSSTFVSGSVRSFFDQIRFDTNHDEIARQRLKDKYKSSGIGPGSYEVSPVKQKKINKYQFFGSTEERN